MDLPLITAVHYREGGVWSGQARCRAGHTLSVPDPEVRAWFDEHAECRHAAVPVRLAAVVPVPDEACEAPVPREAEAA